MKKLIDWLRKHVSFAFNLPSIKGYSTFGMALVYYTAWPSAELGTNYWCLEICIGPPKWHMCRGFKLDFWNQKDLGGWTILISKDGSKTTTRLGGEGKIIYV